MFEGDKGVMKGERILKERLIVVSNREPYVFRRGRLEKSVGGLVTALDPVMQATRGIWIAAGSSPEAGPRSKVPPEAPSYTLRRVFLSEEDLEGYYNGYSNRFLWPLCHITLDRIYLRNSYWESYQKVNRVFADAVIEELGRGKAIVWLQDYHLALCGKYIRARRPRLKISLFWHIPWPPHDVFRICPQRVELLEGLLANDLLGFQLESYRLNFLRCVSREMGLKTDLKRGLVYYNGRTIRVKAFPISVDFEWFEESASTRRAERFLERFKKKYGLEGQLLGLGVDRLDYTKGILKCFDTLELFFAKYPRYRGRFTFIQVAVPTRKIEPYLSYMERVRKRVESINRRYSTSRWQPIRYIEGRLSHEDLAALYRGADLAMISSVYDGMNLVAKEYVASPVDLKGALLLSEFAGAAEDMPGAILINPYDTEGCADAIKSALEAPMEKKRETLQDAREHVKRNNIFRWVNEIIKEFKCIP